MSSLKGKVALVTGGASGIGRATVERLAAEGASVIVADIDVRGGSEVASKAGGEFVELDVAEPDRWQAVVESATTRHGGIDLAFLNAGISTLPAESFIESDRAEQRILRGYSISELPLDRYARILAINISGVVLGARSVVPAMRRRGGGKLIATASLAGLLPFAADPIYTMTKHAVIGLVRALAGSLSAEGIDVHALCPAVVETAILGADGAERVKAAGLPLIPPSQIAEAFMQAVQSAETGGLWVCLPGMPARRYAFASPLPGGA